MPHAGGIKKRNKQAKTGCSITDGKSIYPGGSMKSLALSMMIVLLLLTGCHTTASFMLPPNTGIVIDGVRVADADRDEAGNIRLDRRPFFWDSIVGIKYELIQDDKVIKKDKLPSAFRVVSVFFPPYAILYWPVGFRFNCYDLTNPKKEFIERCGAAPVRAPKTIEPVAAPPVPATVPVAAPAPAATLTAAPAVQ
jgi:hypothetical protein